MKRTDFLRTLKSPLPNAVLKLAPFGHIMQYWSENPELYSAAFGQTDDLHQYLGGHSGIDMTTFHGDPVYAAHDGYVETVKTDRASMGGMVVYLNSPELEDEDGSPCRIQTAYAHLDSIAVALGQQVHQGDMLGREGNTGFVVSGGTPYWGDAPAGVGTHLHFGLHEHNKVNGTWRYRYINTMGNSSDPLPYISDPTPFDDVADGNLSGLRNVLENARRYLLSLVR